MCSLPSGFGVWRKTLVLVGENLSRISNGIRGRLGLHHSAVLVEQFKPRIFLVERETFLEAPIMLISVMFSHLSVFCFSLCCFSILFVSSILRYLYIPRYRVDFFRLIYRYLYYILLYAIRL